MVKFMLLFYMFADLHGLQQIFKKQSLHSWNSEAKEADLTGPIPEALTSFWSVQMLCI